MPKAIPFPNTRADLKNQIRRLRLAMMPTSKGAWRAETVITMAMQAVSDAAQRRDDICEALKSEGLKLGIDYGLADPVPPLLTLLSDRTHERDALRKERGYLRGEILRLWDSPTSDLDSATIVTRTIEKLRHTVAELANRTEAADAHLKNLQAERAAHAETKERLSDALADIAENDARLRELTNRANHWEGVAVNGVRAKARDAGLSGPSTSRYGHASTSSEADCAMGKHLRMHKSDGTPVCGFCGLRLSVAT